MLILTAWETAYRVIGWQPVRFPAPSHVLDSLLNLAGFQTGLGQPLSPHWPGVEEQSLATGDRPLLWAPLVSGYRLVVGFVISIVAGLVLGLSMWRWRFINDFLGPLFLGLQTLPSVCWVPLAVIIFGLQEQGILFVLVMGSCFAIAISLRDGLRVIPPVYQRAGLMLGAGGWRMYRYVLLPASLPAMASSLRQGFSFAWRSLMGAELVMSSVRNHGLGYHLEMGRAFLDTAQVVAVMAIMIGAAMLVDRTLFAPLERSVHRRFGLIPA